MAVNNELITPLFSEIAILDSFPDPVIAVDTRGIIQAFNQKASKVFGSEQHQVLGRPARNFPEICLDPIHNNNPSVGPVCGPSGEYFEVSVLPWPQQGEIAGFVAVFRDVSVLRVLQEELAREKELKSTLEMVLEDAYDGIMVVNATGIITMVNRAYCKFLGFEEHQLLGKPVASVVENTRLHIVLGTGKPEVGELQRTGRQAFVAMRVPIIKDGKITGAMGKIMFKNIRELNILARKVNALKNELAYYKDELQKFRGARYNLEAFVGNSRAVQNLKETVKRVARTDSPILIRGEPGTGKQLLAHALHIESARKNGPFIQVNCAGLPPGTLAVELFGSPGKGKSPALPGKVCLAHQGTLFLEEINALPLMLQEKLVGLLREPAFFAADSEKPNPLDLRVIATTTHNLEYLVKKGLFREDLYCSLIMVSLFIPPLRERIQDLPELVNLFIRKYNQDFGLAVKGMNTEAMRLLQSYHWPGNATELSSVIEQAFNFVDGEVITVSHLPMYLHQFGREETGFPAHQNLQSLLEQTERAAILRALFTSNGNKMQAAQILGISRAGLYQKLLKYNIGE
ncbi:MAG: sigma 54-interacting transcriptional regulator [Heliobacteriaceae bacterium]|nr:sigma 54-interacting transcriptional regulator [Heliobacteriaceae bacterium]MDD4586812.1 sigma 54-interacting transcriptional regulator [Heliobacteriaceae bacterium]